MPSAPSGGTTTPDAVDSSADYPLGAARGQVHATYILSQTESGIVIVDQHAAHERLVYERIKKDLSDAGVARQMLLLPEVVELLEDDVALLGSRAGGDALVDLPRGAEEGFLNVRGRLCRAALDP